MTRAGSSDPGSSCRGFVVTQPGVFLPTTSEWLGFAGPDLKTAKGIDTYLMNSEGACTATGIGWSAAKQVAPPTKQCITRCLASKIMPCLARLGIVDQLGSVTLPVQTEACSARGLMLPWRCATMMASPHACVVILVSHCQWTRRVQPPFW
jgi:hypothetical protein